MIDFLTRGPQLIPGHQEYYLVVAVTKEQLHNISILAKHNFLTKISLPVGLDADHKCST